MDLIIDRLQYGQGVLITSTTRYFLFTGIAFGLFWVLLRGRLHHRRVQKRWPQNGRIAFDLRHSVVGLLAITTATTIGSFLRPLGYMQIYDDPAARGWPYFAFTVVLMYVAQDAYIYWTHRLMHHKSFFRATHAVHHNSVNPSPFSSYSVNWIEGMVHGIYLPIVAVLIPINLWAVAVFMVVMLTGNIHGHLGYELMPRWFARNPITKWIVTPTYHSLHHQRSNCNYAPYFTWWDRWMGTDHPDYDEIFDEVAARPLLARVDSPEPTT